MRYEVDLLIKKLFHSWFVFCSCLIPVASRPDKRIMQQTNLRKIQTLEQQIAASRERLQTLWDIYGTTTAKVLAASIELDDLINQYQKLKSKIKF